MDFQSKPKKQYYPPMHTAEHILNRTMVNMFGCERSTNCHIERKKSKCDFILDKQPTDEQIALIEKKVNEIIDKNLEISESFISYAEASKIYKVRVEEAENPIIRIISIGDYDHCPCIGEHVGYTSEIGKFKITSYSYNDNILRIRFKLIKTQD